MNIRVRGWHTGQKKMYSPEEMSADQLTLLPTGEFVNVNSTSTRLSTVYPVDKFIPLLSTGLHDKNGLAEIYEGDIIDANGTLKGNIYESPQIFKEGIDCLIEGMGTEAWRNTESVAMGRGCKYAK